MSRLTVSVQIECSPDACLIFLRAIVGVGCEDAVDQPFFRDGRWAWFVVIVDEVVASSLAGIAAVGGSPVVEYVVAKVYQFVVGPT